MRRQRRFYRKPVEVQRDELALQHNVIQDRLNRNLIRAVIMCSKRTILRSADIPRLWPAVQLELDAKIDKIENGLQSDTQKLAEVKAKLILLDITMAMKRDVNKLQSGG